MKSRSGKFRIIAGEHRGRVLQFPVYKSLRPTPERVRETLFNWLAAYTPQSNCLDLFAGSGCLGFEAASRGAKQIQFIDCEKTAIKAIKHNIETLNLENAKATQQDAIQYLKQCKQRFDLIFLDPPYQSESAFKAMQLLSQQNLVSHDGWIYLEFSRHLPIPQHPEQWQKIRDTKAGDVQAILFQVAQSDNKESIN